MTKLAKRVDGTWPPRCAWPDCDDVRDLRAGGRNDLCTHHRKVEQEQRDAGVYQYPGSPQQ